MERKTIQKICSGFRRKGRLGQQATPADIAGIFAGREPAVHGIPHNGGCAVSPDNDISRLFPTVFERKVRGVIVLPNPVDMPSEHVVVARNEVAKRSIEIIPRQLGLRCHAPINDSARFVESQALSGDHTDAGDVFASGGTQDRERLLLAQQTCATPVKSAHRTLVNRASGPCGENLTNDSRRSSRLFE